MTCSTRVNRKCVFVYTVFMVRIGVLLVSKLNLCVEVIAEV